MQTFQGMGTLQTMQLKKQIQPLLIFDNSQLWICVQCWQEEIPNNLSLGVFVLLKL